MAALVESAVLYHLTCPALRHEKMWFHPMTEEVHYVIPHEVRRMSLPDVLCRDPISDAVHV